MEKRPYFDRRRAHWQVCAYKDGLAITLAHSEAVILMEAANICQELVVKASKSSEVALRQSKCNNLLQSPGSVRRGY